MVTSCRVLFKITLPGSAWPALLCLWLATSCPFSNSRATLTEDLTKTRCLTLLLKQSIQDTLFKSGAAVMQHMRKIMCLLRIKKCKRILLGPQIKVWTWKLAQYNIFKSNPWNSFNVWYYYFYHYYKYISVPTISYQPSWLIGTDLEKTSCISIRLYFKTLEKMWLDKRLNNMLAILLLLLLLLLSLVCWIMSQVYISVNILPSIQIKNTRVVSLYDNISYIQPIM